MSRMGVDQDHEIISESRVLDTRERSISGGLLRPLEHTVHLIEVDITEQWGDDALNAKDNFQFERKICGWKLGLNLVDMRRKR